MQTEGHHVLGADAQDSSPDGADAADAVRGSIPSAVLSEFVASMLEQEQEPRLKKVLIMCQVDGFDAPDAPVPCCLLPCSSLATRLAYVPPVTSGDLWHASRACV